MADLVTRLRLDNKEFDDNIRKSQAQIKTLENIGNSVTSGLKSMGAQFLAAAGLMEGFSAAIESNSILQDGWNEAITTAKTSVDSFFTSLTTGDWSVFEKGIGNAISLSNRYAVSLRQLKNAIKVGDVRISDDEKELNKYENIASNSNLSYKERQDALKQLQSKGNEVIKYTDNLSKYFNTQLNNMLSAKGIEPNDNVRQMIFDYLDPSTAGAQLLNEYETLYNKVQTAKRGSEAIATNPLEAQFKAQSTENLKAYTKQLDELTARFPKLKEAYKLKVNFGGEGQLDQLLDFTDKIVGYEDRIESVKKQISDASNTFTKGNAEEIIPDGSIKDLKNKIADLNKKIELEIDPTKRAQLQIEVDQLDKELKDKLEKTRIIKFKIDHPNDPGFVKQRKTSISSISGAQPSDALKIDNQKFKNPYSKKDIKTNNKYIDSLNAISQIMGNVTAMTNEGAAAWLSWAGNLMSAVATAIPAITALVTAKKAEAVTNGVASATQTPIVGWLLAGAAAAAVIGALAAVPAFAGGGIFESNLTSGDKNFARLNGGEMILNKGQQYNLFKLLDGGSPISNGGKVQFKISGKELVGVLSNYNNQISKIR